MEQFGRTERPADSRPLAVMHDANGKECHSLKECIRHERDKDDKRNLKDGVYPPLQIDDKGSGHAPATDSNEKKPKNAAKDGGKPATDKELEELIKMLRERNKQQEA